MKKLAICTLVLMMLVGIGLAVYAQEAPPAPVLTFPAGIVVPGAEITFQWETSAGATDYWLSVFKVDESEPFFSEAVGLTTAKTVTGFPDDGATYGWSVAAGNDSGWNAADPVNFVNGAAAPIPPQTTLTTPLDLSNVGGTEITFSWSPSPGAIGYWLTVQSLPLGAFYYNEYVGAVTEKTIDFPDDGTTYGWSVAAGGLSGWSDAAVPFTFANTDAPIAPAAPVLITPADGVTISGTEIYFEWTAPAGALGYWLVVWDDSDGTSVFDGYVGNVTSKFVDGFANDGTSYSWYVAAGNFGGYTAAGVYSFTNTTAELFNINIYVKKNEVDYPDGASVTTVPAGQAYDDSFVTVYIAGVEEGLYFDYIRVVESGGTEVVLVAPEYIGSQYKFTMPRFDVDVIVNLTDDPVDATIEPTLLEYNLASPPTLGYLYTNLYMNNAQIVQGITVKVNEDDPITLVSGGSEPHYSIHGTGEPYQLRIWDRVFENLLTLNAGDVCVFTIDFRVGADAVLTVNVVDNGT